MANCVKLDAKCTAHERYHIVYNYYENIQIIDVLYVLDVDLLAYIMIIMA